MRSRPGPLRIGLTGGIASGKSTIADMFAAREVAVIDTDIIARDVVAPGQPALSEIRQRFGPDVLNAAGELRRRRLRELVFADETARRDLEAILHPRIRAETIRQAGTTSGPYQIIVVPLLVGSSLRSLMDRVLVVDCSEEEQMRRLQQRDGENAAQAHSMIAAQASRAERLAIADDVIMNDGLLSAAEGQVDALHKRYLELARQRQRPAHEASSGASGLPEPE